MGLSKDCPSAVRSAWCPLLGPALRRGGSLRPEAALASNSFRSCRFSRLQRFSPPDAAQVCCALLPAMRFTVFRASGPRTRRSWVSSAVPTARFIPLEGFPSSVAVPHRCGRCPPAVAAPSVRRSGTVHRLLRSDPKVLAVVTVRILPAWAVALGRTGRSRSSSWAPCFRGTQGTWAFDRSKLRPRTFWPGDPSTSGMVSEETTGTVPRAKPPKRPPLGSGPHSAILRSSESVDAVSGVVRGMRVRSAWTSQETRSFALSRSACTIRGWRFRPGPRWTSPPRRHRFLSGGRLAPITLDL